ncbi:MAG: GNAT family protein [Deltaproteobacteria bacterium]|nr:GNAT family protein [Deltaproteobacteria bacterium]
MLRRLQPTDAEAYFALRRAALLDAPLAFGAAPEDDVASSPEAVRGLLARGDDNAVFGALDGAELVGAVGIFREHHRKAAHKARIWGMYVVPAQRGRGLAQALLAAAIQHARDLGGIAWVHLSVTSAAPAARHVYQQAGFRLWGTETDALRCNGESADEHHLALRL